MAHVAATVEMVFPYAGDPFAELRIDEARPSLTLRIESDQMPPAALIAMRHVAIGSIAAEGKRFLTVTVLGEGLLLDGHAMLCAIADRVQLEHQPPVDAITETITQWRAVLAARTRLTAEAEIGLTGELLLLEALQAATGASAVDAWRGSANEEHDFGLTDVDVEVKTTSSERRTHWISGVHQLQPTMSRPLVLVSMQITRGGSAGRTLAETVAAVRKAENDSSLFDTKLSMAGWHDAEADLFVERWTLRSTPVAFNVSDHFPRLTPLLLDRLPIRSDSIVETHYRIDLEGLPGSVIESDALSTAVANVQPAGG